MLTRRKRTGIGEFACSVCVALFFLCVFASAVEYETLIVCETSAQILRQNTQ